mmetsp:Transcript_108178/g.336296  ORF Transcript_108178/g.336296 Transcript_108178/m.336296 type:complete len:118 (+) Transcript_108178:520-873(+)
MGGHKGLQCLGPHSAVARAEACRCRAHVQRGDVRATASARSLRGQQGGPGFRLGARGGPPALAARSCGQIPRMHRRTQSSVLAPAGTLLACEWHVGAIYADGVLNTSIRRFGVLAPA